MTGPSGSRNRLVVCGYIRPEAKFEGDDWLSQLKAAITSDVHLTDTTLESEPAFKPSQADLDFLHSQLPTDASNDDGGEAAKAEPSSDEPSAL